MIENAQIQSIQNKDYNPTDHDYELNLNQSTKIQEVADVASRDVPTTLYTFSNISDISSFSNGSSKIPKHPGIPAPAFPTSMFLSGIL